MREDVPLAAPGLGHCQDQIQDPERVPVSPGPAAGLGEPAWEAFYALVFVASTILVEAAPRDAATRTAASLALAAMIPWYLILARPVMRMDSEKTWHLVAVSWRGPVYLTGMTVLLAVALYANPNAWFLAFALSPQCFQLITPNRRAMAFVILLNSVAGLVFALDDSSAQNIATAVGTVLFAIAFSEVFSRWMARVIEQSHERAALIAQLESAQTALAAAHHEAGVLAERQRLAAEIHDTLAQGFLSIIALIQAAQASRVVPAAAGRAGGGPASADPARADPAGAEPTREHLDLALDTARENLAEARALVAALAPASLDDDAGLAGALDRATRAAAREAGIEATCAAEGAARPLPTATEVVLLRVCQESLANVRKHAAANRVDVRLRYTQAEVELSVTDDGGGFDARFPAVTGTGFGLRGMRERLRQAGGTFTVVSAPDAGTTVRAEIPG